ncbi:MAG: type II secretion system protein GspC [Nitrospirota bacterium]
MKNNKKLYALMLMALLTVSAYFLADTVDSLIGRSLEASPKFTSSLERDRTPFEPRRELSDYNSILERGFFGEGRVPSQGGRAAAESSSYRLIGTVEGDSFAGAVMEEATGQTFYRLNQKLPDGAVIVKVFRDKIRIKRPGGSTVDVQVVDDTKIVNVPNPGTSKGSGVKKVSEGKWMVDQKEMLASKENLSQILTQARALPYQEQGKTVGFRLSEIVPGSIYEKIGLQNGDVIRQINSQDVDDPGKFFQMYQGLQNERAITIDVVRNGQRQTLNYEIR